MAEVVTHQRRVLLFDEPVVLLVIGTAAGELDTWDGFIPEAEHMVVEELAAVVGVDLQDGEGKTS